MRSAHNPRICVRVVWQPSVMQSASEGGVSRSGMLRSAALLNAIVPYIMQAQQALKVSQVEVAKLQYRVQHLVRAVKEGDAALAKCRTS